MIENEYTIIDFRNIDGRNRMKKGIKTIILNAIVLVIGSVLGLLALIAVHMLPVQPMQANVYWSLGMIEKEFSDEVLIDGYNATLTGNFTDCLMLEHAVYSNDEHTVLEQVLNMYRAESYYDEFYEDGWWPGQSLVDYLYGTAQPREVTYGRYWHGYLVILKPLLYLTNVNTIRLLNASLQLILAGFVAVELGKKGSSVFAKAFMISLPFMFFVSSFSSLSLSICLYIMLGAMLVQCKWGNILSVNSRYMYFFLVVGMITAYLDFLTYPLVTLAYPLCVCLYFESDKTKQGIKKIFIYSLEWMIGYGGMWAAKWVLSDLLIGSTTIKDALINVFTRTQSAENTTRFSGFFLVLSKNLQVYLNWGFILLLIVLAIVFVVKIFKTGIKNVIRNLSSGIVFFIVAVSPLVWYFVLENHSEQHWPFTCRIMAISVFAGITGVNRIFEKKI